MQQGLSGRSRRLAHNQRGKDLFHSHGSAKGLASRVRFRVSDNQRGNLQPVEVQPVEAQPVEAQPVEAQPVEVQPVEVQLLEAQLSEAQLLEAQLLEAQPVDAQLRRSAKLVLVMRLVVLILRFGLPTLRRKLWVPAANPAG